MHHSLAIPVKKMPPEGRQEHTKPTEQIPEKMPCWLSIGLAFGLPEQNQMKNLFKPPSK